MGKTSTSRCFRNGLCEMQRRWNYKSSVDKFTIKMTWVPGQRQRSKAGDMILFYLALPIKQERN
jgi:hypothetical protein